MPKRYTPAEVLDALREIAETAAAGYHETLATLPADAKTERKALIIQREMAGLYIRTILPGLDKTPTAELLSFMERRLRQIAGTHYPAVLTFYDTADEADRHLMLPYLLGWCFQDSQFIRPQRAERARAEAAGDVAVAFELEIKTATITDVLHRGAVWWQEQSAAGRLPIIPSVEDMLYE